MINERQMTKEQMVSYFYLFIGALTEMPCDGFTVALDTETKVVTLTPINPRNPS